MAKIKPQMPRFYRSSNFRRALFAPFIILATGPHHVGAQLQHPPTNIAPSSAAPTTILDSTDGDTLFIASSASASAFALPSSTDGAGYASHNNNRSPETRVLNYYFLLLAVLIIVIALVWWSLARRRRNRMLHLRDNQQSVLARDLQTWPERRRGGAGRWGFGGVEPRAEEGVEERGEAPPPYLKEPDPVHRADGPGTELHYLSSGEAKPPNYDEGSARR